MNPKGPGKPNHKGLELDCISSENESAQQIPKIEKKNLMSGIDVKKTQTKSNKSEIEIETFHEKIIQKYETQKESENDVDRLPTPASKRTGFSLTPKRSMLDDYFNKKNYMRNKTINTHKSFAEDLEKRKVRELENKENKQIHLLRSAFLVDTGCNDRELNEKMLFNSRAKTDERGVKKGKKERVVPEEDYENKHNQSLLDSIDSSGESDPENHTSHKRKFQIESLHLLRLKNEENSFLRIIEMSPLEKLNQYSDNKPLLKFRKAIWKIFFYFTLTCHKIVKNPLFEFVSISVIIFNTIILAMDDPTDVSGNSLSDKLDNLFLGLYSVELGLKIFGHGRQFYKDNWNLFDSVIVLFSWLDNFTKNFNYSFTSFRSLRVLRPLKTISTIKKLRMLIQTILSSVPFLIDILLILGFVYLMFAIGGLYIFSGVLLKKCFLPETGTLHGGNLYCSDTSICPDGYKCGKMMSNPNWGVTNFDNLGSSFLMVFQITTLEGWFPIMEMLTSSFSAVIGVIIYIYFIMLIFIGNFFILNLTLAVIIVKFNESQGNKTKGLPQSSQHRVDCPCVQSLPFSKMVRCGMFSPLKISSVNSRIGKKLEKARKKHSAFEVNPHFSFKYKSQGGEVLQVGARCGMVEENRVENEFIRGIELQDSQAKSPSQPNMGSLRNSFYGRSVMANSRQGTFFQSNFALGSHVPSEENPNSIDKSYFMQHNRQVIPRKQSGFTVDNKLTESGHDNDEDQLIRLTKEKDIFLESSERSSQFMRSEMSQTENQKSERGNEKGSLLSSSRTDLKLGSFDSVDFPRTKTQKNATRNVERGHQNLKANEKSFGSYLTPVMSEERSKERSRPQGKSMTNLVQMIKEKIYTANPDNLEVSPNQNQRKSTGGNQIEAMRKRMGSLSENRSQVVRVPLSMQSQNQMGRKSSIGGRGRSSNGSEILKKKRTKENLMEYYQQSVKESSIMDGEGQALLNIENLKLQLLNEKKKDLIRTYTNEKKGLDVRGAKRRSQRNMIGMMNGFNEMVINAKRGLETQKSLQGRELGGFTKKMFKKITKRSSNVSRKKGNIKKELER